MLPFSERTRSLRSSQIRQLMKLAADPTIISFSGGMPENQLLPTELCQQLWAQMDESEKRLALQYGPTSGLAQLQEALASYLLCRNIPVKGKKILITTGAQQALQIVARLFIDPGDTVACEYPSFIGALAAFSSCGAKNVAVPLNENGVDLAKLEAVIATQKPKFFYFTPFFHNPAGISYSEQTLQELGQLLQHYNVAYLEDNPYGELYFSKPPVSPLFSRTDDYPAAMYVGSLAKVFGPGLRLGYMVADEAIIEKAELIKQSLDACSSNFSQLIAARFLTSEQFEPTIARLRAAYRQKCHTMLEAMQHHFPPEVTWSKPDGGFFSWVDLSGCSNESAREATALFHRCIEKKAAFVVGEAFDPLGKKNDCFRLAYSNLSLNKITQGIEIIGKCLS